MAIIIQRQTRIQKGYNTEAYLMTVYDDTGAGGYIDFPHGLTFDPTVINLNLLLDVGGSYYPSTQSCYVGYTNVGLSGMNYIYGVDVNGNRTIKIFFGRTARPIYYHYSLYLGRNQSVVI